MSLRQQWVSMEQQVKDLQARMEEIEKDPSFAAEKDFEEKLRALMGEYGKSLRDIIALLDPDSVRRGGQGKADQNTKAARRPRAVKTYKNPHNGEIVETKGGNHKTLKDWKSKWGAAEVESWVQ